MMRIIFLLICHIVIMPGNCDETVYTLDNKLYKCEGRDPKNSSWRPQSCKTFARDKTMSNYMLDTSIYDSDNVRYFISGNRPWAQNIDGKMYEIVLGDRYLPMMMKMDQMYNTLFILASPPGSCLKEGGLFVLNTKIIRPNMNMQIVINKMEDLGDSFTWLGVSGKNEVQLLTKTGRSLVLTPKEFCGTDL